MKRILTIITAVLLVAGCTQQPAKPETIGQGKAVSIAKELAQSKGRDLKEYEEPKCELNANQDEWRLTFMGTVVPSPGNYFTVVIDAKNGNATLIPGE